MANMFEKDMLTYWTARAPLPTATTTRAGKRERAQAGEWGITMKKDNPYT